MMKQTSLALVSLMTVNCGISNISGNEPQRIAVASQNNLGVAELEVERSVQPDGDVFELVALDANHDQVASVRLRIGSISDLPDLLPTTETSGSEIVLTYGTVSNRLVSRETQVFQLAINPDPGLQSFLEIAEVAATLEHDANILVDLGEAAYTTCTASVETCPTNTLLSSPVAVSCCMRVTSCTANRDVFHRSTDQLVIVRTYGGVCMPAGCQGAACTYGPNGWSRPTVTAGSAAYGVTSTGGTAPQCIDGPQYQNGYPSVTGTFPKNQGCPGADPGYGDWDY